MTPAKSLFLQTAQALHLDACGVASAAFPPELQNILENNGPVPFAPDTAALRLSPETLLSGAKSFMVLLFPYKPKNDEGGNIALYARPLDYHSINHRYLSRIIETMQTAYPEEQFLPLVDTSPMVDRWLAYQAGLGFFGKNHCLIHPKYGSYVTIGSVLTTLDLPPDTPLSLSCGTCHGCMNHCPGQVITETHFNPWHCKSFLTQKKEPLTEEEIQILRRTPYIFGCDECQKYCPYNQQAPISSIPEIHENRMPLLTEEMMNQYSNRNFDKTFRPYAFAWRGKKVLLRNWEIIHRD